MGGLIDKAAFGAAVGNLPGYATAEAELPQSQFKLQGLVQCSPDIVGSPCEKCLKSALKQMDGWATTMIFLPSCNLRFGLYSSQFNAPPPTPSPPPPPPPPGWLIPVAVVTSLSLLAGVVFLIQRYTGFINCTPRKQDGVRTEHSAASTSAEPVSPSFTDSSDDTVVPLDMPEFEALLHKIEVIREATEDFSENNWIGGGGFGDVYRGVLPNGQAIAVKRLSSISDQGEREFNNEVVLLANLRHRNLVKLLGFCIAGSEKYLVYEFVPNNSLAEFIYHSERRPQLNWPMRVKIIKGIARGMLYLHRDSPDRIIHRDLKPANVLLDVHMVPKIADFGLARITNFQQTHIETSNVAGTRGYIAPEYFLYGHFSVRSDVYSFGVIMLEMVSGRRVGAVVNQDGVIQVPGLVSYAWSCWARGELLPLIDATLGNEYSEYEVYRRIQIGLLCVQEDTYMRPDMETVVRWLNTAEDLPTPEHHGFHALQILHEEVFHDLEDA